MDEEGARQALELDLFAVVERDVVRTGDQLTHELRDQDLAALGLAGDASREDDVTTEQIAALGDGLARVQADAHPHALVRVSPGVALDLLLDGDRARQSASRALLNASMKPSPCDLISLPPWVRSSLRMISLCARSTCIHWVSPYFSASIVEFSMSVNITVTVQSRWLSRDMFGSSVLIPEATRSIEVNRSPLSRARTRPSGEIVGGPMTVPRAPAVSCATVTAGGGVTRVMVVSPTATKSFGDTGVGPTTRVPLMNVPFELPRSSTVRPPAFAISEA